MPNQTLIPAERIRRSILMVRGQRIMLDADLAFLYGVSTRELVQAVKRNSSRFPSDFMFQLTRQEARILRSQAVISSSDHGGRRTRPYAFTEHGVTMLSSVLRSTRAIQVDIAVVRAFSQIRHLLESHADLGRKLESMQAKYDDQFTVVFRALRGLLAPRQRRRRLIGFQPATRPPQAKVRARAR